MGNIVQLYTAEQLYNLYRNKMLSDDVGLTDFNEGSSIRTLLESNSEIISTIGFDFKQGLYNSIPVALYEGFGFERKGETESTGSLRLYRKPLFFIEYSGSGTSATITSSATNITSAVTGAPSDAFSFAYSTYETLTDLVSAIDGLTNWSATLVKDESIESTTIYQYSNKEVIGASNYLNSDGLDIMTQDDSDIEVVEGFSCSINDQTFLTTADGTLLAGEASVIISASSTKTGLSTNISAGAIDTLNGKGYIISSIDGIEHVKNDSAFSGGSAKETKSERKTRFKETINSLNAGTKYGIIAAIKGITGVRDAGMRTAFPFKGTNTIIVDDGSGSISSDLQAEIEKVLYGDPDDFTNYPGKNAEGVGYNIVAPTIKAVDIGITATRLSNIRVDLDEIKTSIQTAVEQYVNTRTLGQNVLLSEIYRTGKNSNSAIYDLVVISPSANVVVSDSQFAKTGGTTGGSVNVTVTIATSE